MRRSLLLLAGVLACGSEPGGSGGEASSSSGSSEAGSATTPTTSSPTTTNVPESSGEGTSSESASASSVDESSSSTGASPGCGDGEIGDDEVCDDGNAIDGDGCNADCTPSGAVHWEVVRDGELHGGDIFVAPAIADDGSVLVTGYVAEANPAGRELVVVGYDAAGVEAWQYVTGANSQNDQGNAIAALEGDAVVAGFIAGNTMQYLGRVADGAALWENDAIGGAGGANAVVIADGAIVVGGIVDGRGYLASFDGDGASGWSWMSPMTGGCNPCDRIMDLAIAANGDVLAAGERAEDEPFKDALLARFSPDGDELWSAVDEQLGTNESMYRVSEDGSGDILTVRGDADELSYVRRYAADGSSFDELDLDDTEYVADVAASPLGGYLLAVNTTDGSAVRRHGDDDVMSWEQTWATPAGGAVFAYALAIDANGVIVVAGAWREDMAGNYDGWLVSLGQ